MQELSNKPHYLDWVRDEAFIKERRTWAKEYIGTIPKDLISEIMMVEGGRGIKEEKRERLINTHLALHGEFPLGRNFNDYDRIAWSDRHFDFVPFHCEEFWNDYFSFVFKGLNKEKTHVYHSYRLIPREIATNRYIDDSHKQALFQLYNGDSFTPVRSMLGYSFDRDKVKGSFLGESAFHLFDDWIFWFGQTITGKLEPSNVFTNNIEYLNSLLPFLRDSIKASCGYDKVAIHVGGGGSTSMFMGVSLSRNRNIQGDEKLERSV